MTVINLTQLTLKEKQGNFLLRLGLRVMPEIYYVSSLAEMQDYFSINTPSKKLIWKEIKSAYVWMYNIQIKRHCSNAFDEKDTLSLEADLNKEYATPLFDLRDVTAQRIAQWQAGTAEDFFAAENTFHFNQDTFVPIPRILLCYHCISPQGVMDIVAMQDKNTRNPETSSLFDKVLRWLPQLPPEEPQPAVA